MTEDPKFEDPYMTIHIVWAMGDIYHIASTHEKAFDWVKDNKPDWRDRDYDIESHIVDQDWP